MRILIYTSTEEWSGTSRVLIAAARLLAGRGHAVTLACCEGTRIESLARDENIETVPIEGAWFGSGGAWELRKVLQSRFIEVAIVCNEHDHRIVASAMRFAERGAVLRRIAAFDPLDSGDVSKLSLRLASAGLLLTSQEEIARIEGAAWPIPPQVVPIGIDATSYDAVEPMPRGDIGAPPQGLLIACDYDPSGRQRIGPVFRTLALLAPRHAHLHAVIMGPGSDDDELRMHASALGVGRVVSFLGDRVDARRVMRAADAGWVVSSGDAGALNCLDFMALRIPIIAERTPLTQHYVADGITGVLLAPGEPSYTASVVAEFLSRDDKRIAMGNAARARVQREFPEQLMADGFEAAIKAAGDRTAWQTT